MKIKNDAGWGGEEVTFKVEGLKVRAVSRSSAELFVDDMGTWAVEEGAPIYLEFCDKKWELFVWSDINQEDPTHRIDMSGALEANRVEDK